VSPPRTIAGLRDAAAAGKACDLWKKATVFGEGPTGAGIMLVGEQPGDQEDRSGRRKTLDEALAKAGIDHEAVYVTNVVKDFKWTASERGKRRIHKKPDYSEIQACRPCLDAEIRVVKPQILVCLGATAAPALLGRNFSVNRQRGQRVDSSLAPHVVATVHPSSILRAPDEKSRQTQMRGFINDLRRVARLIRDEQAA